MFLVTVVCSDPECLEERELVVADLDDVDCDVCECGHGFVVATIAELDEAGATASVISLRRPQRDQVRPAAGVTGRA